MLYDYYYLYFTILSNILWLMINRLLSLENLRDANIVYEKFLENIKLDTPLINFLRFLLLTLERNALPLFKLLKVKYSVALRRDKSFDEVRFKLMFIIFVQ